MRVKIMERERKKKKKLLQHFLSCLYAFHRIMFTTYGPAVSVAYQEITSSAILAKFSKVTNC